MKKICVLAVSLASITNVVIAQHAKPELLKQPDNWEFERFALPPAFAPDITYKGFEELRFAPGMFKKDSLNYFTYVFVASIDSINKISQKDIQTYLTSYFKGLCSTVAKDNKLTIDTSKITATIVAPTRKGTFNFLVNVFGVFADGAMVKLNMEVNIIRDDAHKRIYLFFIASPQPKTSVVWKELYQIRNDLKIPAD